VTRQKGGARASGQEVDSDARSSLSASFAWPTSCPLRWSRYSLMLLVKRVGKRSERVTAVFIGAEPTPRPLAPRGVVLRTKGRAAIPSRPSFNRPQERFALIGLPCGQTGTSTRRAPAFSASLLAVRCFPHWRTLVHGFPRLLSHNTAVPAAPAHKGRSCERTRPDIRGADYLRSSARFLSVSHAFAAASRLPAAAASFTRS
jgi:hypothetical protein